MDQAQLYEFSKARLDASIMNKLFSSAFNDCVSDLSTQNLSQAEIMCIRNVASRTVISEKMGMKLSGQSS